MPLMGLNTEKPVVIYDSSEMFIGLKSIFALERQALRPRDMGHHIISLSRPECPSVFARPY